jgi:Predicted membrane protein
MIDEAPVGARIADAVTSFMGSWRFIILQTLIVVVWVIGNIYLLFHFDAYPFIFLNLAFSTQAAYAAPLILLASNRSSQRDRLTLEHAAAEADIEEKQNEDLLNGNRQILEHVQALDERILKLEQRIVAKLDERH